MIIVSIEPFMFEVFAQTVYERQVTFKNINADIEIMGRVIEYQDQNTNLKNLKIREEKKRIESMNLSNSAKDELFKDKVQQITEKDSTGTNVKSDIVNVAKKFKVKVDRNRLKATNVAKKSVDTYAELLEFQNEMLDNPSKMMTLEPDPKKYPNLVYFLREEKLLAKVEPNYKMKLSDSSQLINPLNASAYWWNGYSDEHAACGYYGQELPRKAVANRSFNVGSSRIDAENKLKAWGYHRTASYASASPTDYTRDKNYNTEWCGYNSFRDHANVTSNCSGANLFAYNCPPYYINEQNYGYVSPNGEPNPEVFRLSWWPYPDWAFYVRNWHNTH